MEREKKKSSKKERKMIKQKHTYREGMKQKKGERERDRQTDKKERKKEDQTKTYIQKSDKAERDTLTSIMFIVDLYSDVSTIGSGAWMSSSWSSN